METQAIIPAEFHNVKQTRLKKFKTHNCEKVVVRSSGKYVEEFSNDFFAEDGKFIVLTGTAISYAGHSGRFLLQELLSAFLNNKNSISEVRERIFGHYAITCYDGEKLYSFVDEIGSYHLFYGYSAGAGVVSTSLIDLWHLGFSAQEGVPALILATFHGASGIYRRTFLKDVYRLQGSECLLYCPRSQRIEIISLPPPDLGVYVSKEQALDFFDAEAKAMFRAISQYNRVKLNITGGLDTRLIFANLLRQGRDFELIYGVGNSRMTNTLPGDLQLAHSISRRFDKALSIMDWTQNEPYTYTERQELFDQNGFCQLYGSTKGVLNSLLEEAQSGALFLGGYNPAFTNIKIWDSADSLRDTKSMADFLMSQYHQLFKCPSDFDETGKFLHNELGGLCRSMNLDPDNLDSKSAVRLFLHQRMAIESSNLIAFNDYSPYVAPFYTSKAFHLLAAVEPEWRRNDHFQIKSILRANPEVLTVPVFSGCLSCEVDLQNEVLIKPELDISPLKSNIKIMLPSILWGPLIKLRRLWWHYLNRNSDSGQQNSRSDSEVFRISTLKALRSNIIRNKISIDKFSEVYLLSFYKFLTLVELVDRQRKVEKT